MLFQERSLRQVKSAIIVTIVTHIAAYFAARILAMPGHLEGNLVPDMESPDRSSLRSNAIPRQLAFQDDLGVTYTSLHGIAIPSNTSLILHLWLRKVRKGCARTECPRLASWQIAALRTMPHGVYLH